MSTSNDPMAPQTTAPPSVGAPASAPAVGAPAMRLPRHLEQMLSWLPQSEWNFIVARVCHLPFTRDLADVVAFVDRVWTQASRAEHRTGKSRITGAEMDIYRARYEEGAREIVAVAAELAQRTGLTEILARNRRMLQRFGLAVAKTEVPAAGSDTTDAATEAA